MFLVRKSAAILLINILKLPEKFRAGYERITMNKPRARYHQLLQLAQWRY